jgi:hypothetical protein
LSVVFDVQVFKILNYIYHIVLFILLGGFIGYWNSVLGLVLAGVWSQWFLKYFLILI